MNPDGYHIHPPGRLSRWGVVDVGLRCMHECKFCYYSFLNKEEDQFVGMKRATFHSADHVKRLVGMLRTTGFIGFDVTGGEPTLSPAIVEIVERAKLVGLAARIITLGQYLTRPMKSAPGHKTLLDGLLAAGVADFLLSVHAVDEENYKKLTGGSWAKMKAAMERLDSIGFDYCTNTTICAENYQLLPQIAREVATHNVYVSNFIVMNAYYAWSRPSGATAQVQGHYGEIAPYLKEARDILEDAGIAVNIRYAPLCTMAGMERNLVGIVGVRHDPHEWMNAIDHMNAGSPEAMGQRIGLKDHETQYPLKPVNTDGIVAARAGKVFPQKCRQCRAVSVCDGVDSNYLRRRGDNELSPYSDFRGDLLDRERLNYLPAFVVKTAAEGKAKQAVFELLRGSNHNAVAAA